MTSYPIDADLDVNSPDPNEASLQAQKLDIGAFSIENLSTESAPGAEAKSSDRGFDIGDLSGDLDEDFPNETLLDVSALERDTGRVDFGSNLDGGGLLERLGTEADSDLTPMIDATDELTSPLVPSNDGVDDRPTVVFDQPTIFPDAPMPASRLRLMKALDALPVVMSEEWIEIDASPRGKSKVPFSRIQTIAMAAVNGLGNRPVLIIDIVLNGSDSTHEPMKLIRFRSDRFDPLGFEPDAANPLAALTAWVSRLQSESNASCLPSRSILGGEFARFDSLEAYERDVLTAVREDGASA